MDWFDESNYRDNSPVSTEQDWRAVTITGVDSIGETSARPGSLFRNCCLVNRFWKMKEPM